MLKTILVICSLVLFSAGAADAQSVGMVWVKRDVGGTIIEATIAPGTAEGYEPLRGDDPEMQRYWDPAYSFKAEIRERFRTDPALRILFEWIRDAKGLTTAQAVAELEALADAILPDP